jgi:hypothetical protein
MKSIDEPEQVITIICLMPPGDLSLICLLALPKNQVCPQMYSATLPQNPGAGGSLGMSAEVPVEKSISSYLTKSDLA